MYIIDIVFTRSPKSSFNNYTTEIIHRGYRIRRYELDYTFVDLIRHIGYIYYNKANIVRLVKKNKDDDIVIIDEFKDEY